ncbi:hypothetical protein EWI07_06165 [Sporolactobacillus sp. THM7-4]|nr:hypothetical protein EWI07_06165 [Sporolactobacillus sp. THM7-4]
MSEKIGLLATARTKAPYEAPVIDFYRSPLFIKSVQYAKQTYDRFYFYNAKDGLLLPDRIMQPYDVSIRTFSREQRVCWGKKVIEELAGYEMLSRVSLCLHGGKIYRDYLEPELIRRGISFTVPLKGLSIGRQMHWYDIHTPRAKI